MTKTWTVWVEDVATHSTCIIDRCSTKGAAEKLARFIGSTQNRVVTISAPSVQY